jgi:hypothetical protein
MSGCDADRPGEPDSPCTDVGFPGQQTERPLKRNITYVSDGMYTK